MKKKSILKKVLLIGLITAAALVLFVPIISRGFLTQYAHRKAEELLQTEIKMSAVELHLLSGSVVVRGLKVYNPIRKEETFIEADKIALTLKYLPILFGKKAQLLVDIDDPMLVYETDRAGNWKLARKIPIFRRGKGEKRLPINVEEITIDDGEVEYRDGKVGKTTRITDLDVSVEDVQLPTKEDPLPAEFEIDFDIGDGGSVAMKGVADFLSPKVSFNADLKVKKVPIPPFAPYYDKKSLPVRVKRGRVAMTSKAKCHKDYLKAPTHVSITKLEVEPKRNKVFGFAGKNAVEAMKDKRGNMELDMVITGNIRNPQFKIVNSFGSAFGKAFSQGLAKDISSGVKSVGSGVEKGAKSGVDKIKGLFGK